MIPLLSNQSRYGLKKVCVSIDYVSQNCIYSSIFFSKMIKNEYLKRIENSKSKKIYIPQHDTRFV